ncbi:MAG: Flp family type IVb pilin [Deltaproteobacteria bacterium]|nr:Flp family type IVb pilin [Deltaproteobacteria bacterium]
MRRAWSIIERKLQSGQTMTEYALILALVVLVGMVAYTTLGTNIKTLVNNVASDL